MNIAFDVWTSVITVQHILAFSIIRFISVRFPIYLKFIRPEHAKVTSLNIYLCKFILIIPTIYDVLIGREIEIYFLTGR